VADKWWNNKNHEKIRNLSQTLFLESMACCTEVTYVNEKLVGDPLDVKMFECSGWSLTESVANDIISSDQNIVLAYVKPKASKSMGSSFSLPKNDIDC